MPLLPALVLTLGLAQTPGELSRQLAENERDVRNAQVARELVGIIQNLDAANTPTARAAAARTLGNMGLDARTAIPAVIQILDNRARAYPFMVDEALVRATGKLGVPARLAIPALIRNAGCDRDIDRAIDEAVASILTALHSAEEVAVLVQQLRNTDPAERLRAAKRLGNLGPDAREAIPDLTAALLDPDRDVSRQALLALQAVRPGAAPSRQALGVYIRDLADDDEAVRLKAAKSLGRLGAAARFALSALQAAARNDPDDDVRRVAADAIGRITGTPP